MLALLATTAVIAIILGVGMPTTGVYVIVSVLLAPALVRHGIEQMSAHLFIFYFGLLSMLTPPVAVASYSAASIANSDMWQTGVTGVRLGIVAYLLPFVFALNPALLMDGTWLEIGVSCLTIVVSGFLLAEVLASRQRLWRRRDARCRGAVLARHRREHRDCSNPPARPAIAIALVVGAGRLGR